jgi:hypothetical protein
MPEAFRTNIIKSGAGVELATVADIRDKDQIGTVVYSDILIRKRPEVAAKLMKAYVRGARLYNDALQDGAIGGPHADEIIDAMAIFSSLKDKSVLLAIVFTAIDPDGRPSIEMPSCRSGVLVNSTFVYSRDTSFPPRRNLYEFLDLLGREWCRHVFEVHRAGHDTG